MALSERLVLLIDANTQGAVGGIGKVSGAAETMGSKVKRTFDTFKPLAIAAGTAIAANFGRQSVAAFAESQKVAAQTAAVIKSTGGAANVSGKDVESLAGKLQKLSGVEDETIQSGQNMLLTFTNVKNGVGKGNDVFDQASKTLLDMSVAMGTEPKQAAIQLGKALNDPIKGISALSRVGVTFTQQQKDQIKALVESGDTMGAQKIILAELNKEFGGSAKAAGDAMTPAEKLSLAYGDLQEKVGSLLLPALSGLADALVKVISVFQSLPGPAVAAIAVVGGLVAAVLVVNKAIQAWTAVQAALNAVMALNPVVLIVVGIAALVAAVILAYKHSETFRAVVQTVWDVLKGVAEFIGGVVVGAFRAISTVVGEVVGFISRNWPMLLAILTGPIGLAVKFITDHFDSIVSFVGGLPGRIASAASGMWDGIKSAFRSTLNTIIGWWNGIQFTLPKVHVPGTNIDVGGFTLGTPDLPRFHEGGIFRAGTPGGEGLALLRDRETVLPPGFAERGRAGRDLHVTINAPNYVGSKDELIRTVVDGLVSWQRRGGGVPW